MRKLFVLATLALFGFGNAPAAAQTFGFGAHAGVSVPTGSYSDHAELGFLGGLDLLYPLAMVTPALSWYTSVDAIAHSSARESVEGGFLYVPVMTGLRFDVPVGPMAAFATGQLGLVMAKPPSDLRVGDVIVEGDSDWTNSFGFNVGGGLRLTDNIYAGVKYYPLGGVDFQFDDTVVNEDVSFLDIYVGFGAF